MKIKALLLSATFLALAAPALAQTMQGGGGGGVTLPIDLASQVTGVLPSINGGAGTVNGILQANGSGATSAVTVGSGLSYSGGTLSATGAGGNANFGTATGNIAGNAICMTNTTVGIQDCGYSASAIPSNKLTSALNAQTGTSYSVSSSTDGGKIVSASNASAVAFTLPAAATLGSGYGVDLNDIGAGALTTTLASGNFDNGATSITTVKGQDLFAWSDGTNVHSWVSLPVMAADTVLGNFSGASNYPIAGTLTDCHAATSAVTYNTTSHAWGCNTISGSGTVNSGTAGDGAYYASSTTAVSDGAVVSVTFGGVNFNNAVTVVNGMSLKTTNNPAIYVNSSIKFDCNTSTCTFTDSAIGSTAGSFSLPNSAASSTVPTLVPNRASSTSGIGAQASGNISIIASGTEIERMVSTGPTIITVPTDAAHTDATLCRDTTSGAMLTGTGTAGICLGTSSRSSKLPNSIVPIAASLTKSDGIPILQWRYKPKFGDPKRLHYSPIADDVCKQYADLCVRKPDGSISSFDWPSLMWLMLEKHRKEIAVLGAENARLHAVNDDLRAQEASFGRRLYALEHPGMRTASAKELSSRR